MKKKWIFQPQVSVNDKQSNFYKDLCFAEHSRCFDPLNRVSFFEFGPYKGCQCSLSSSLNRVRTSVAHPYPKLHNEQTPAFNNVPLGGGWGGCNLVTLPPYSVYCMCRQQSPGGYSHTIPIRACATQQGRDF